MVGVRRLAACWFITFTLVLEGGSICVEAQQTGNSTEKIRVAPGQTASRIGSAIDWQDDFRRAVEEARATAKPIFWYIPTVPGSFMDRKPSIERYMMAGPFSWPGLIRQLNENYVCLRAQPDAELARRFQLLPYEFVEPGFLVISPEGKELRRADRITTFHPDWFQQLLGNPINEPLTFDDELWRQFRAGRYDIEFPATDSPQLTTEAMGHRLLAGMCAFRLGRHEEAKQIWSALAKAAPDHPLGWKAAAEAEGFGPFVRGFEIYRELPQKVLDSVQGEFGSGLPPGIYEEPELWQRGVDYLLGMQRSDGGWFDSDYDFGGTDSLPNVHAAVTSLVAMALLEARERLPEQQTKIDNAIRRAVQFVASPENLNPVDRDELLWAYAYRTRLMARVLKSQPELAATLQEAVQSLEQIQTRQGSWYHEYANSFVTATALLALREAAEAGAKVDAEKVRRGVAALRRDRFVNGAYPYSSRRGGGGGEASPRQIAAAAGRLPLCEVALVRWEAESAESQQMLRQGIETSFDLHGNLEQALKYDDHTSNLGYGGFFYWYDMRGRSEAIRAINDKSVRADFTRRQHALVLARPEVDGAFVDSHELGRCYGTAMALLCLADFDIEPE